MLFICKAPETGSNSTKESKRVTNHIRQQSRSVRGFYYLCFLQKTGNSIQKQKPYSKSIFRNTVSDQHFGTLDIWQFIMTTSSLIEWILLRLLSWNSDKLSLVCPDNAIKLHYSWDLLRNDENGLEGYDRSRWVYVGREPERLQLKRRIWWCFLIWQGMRVATNLRTRHSCREYVSLVSMNAVAQERPYHLFHSLP